MGGGGRDGPGGRAEAFGLIGIWLHGSLAQGSYRRPKSDVDLLLVVEETLNEEARRTLARRLVELSGGRPTVGGLELSVVRLEDARAGRFPMPFEVHYGDELNLCRGLWLHLEAGPWTVPSKEEAGTWALDVVPPEHGAVVRAALEAYRDSRTVGAEERPRAGREWDAEALLAFRDWMAEALC